MNGLSLTKILNVGIDFGQGTLPVGRLALRDRRIYFSYEVSFIGQGLEISPFMLPVEAGVKSFDRNPFEGLPGVFGDSLPDGWGRLLYDRYIRSKGILLEQITPLDRLAAVGSHGFGALVYWPESDIARMHGPVDLDGVASQVKTVLEGDAKQVLHELFVLNGSSAGARPKVAVGVSTDRARIIGGLTRNEDGFEPWLVKFPNTYDGIDAGAVEYVYALMAKKAGLSMSDVHLFSASQGPGYFATKRFDRIGDSRIHMHTVGGLLNADFRHPTLDYQDLLNLTFILTRDIREVEKMFRIAVFNVLAHNRDDHAKNFSFLMDAQGEWTLAPAYDLTFSSGPGGQQSTMVMGEGLDPSLEHLLKLGLDAKLPKDRIVRIIDQTRSVLAEWPVLAAQYGVGRETIAYIGSVLDQVK